MKNANDPSVITSPEYRKFIEDLKARVAMGVGYPAVGEKEFSALAVPLLPLPYEKSVWLERRSS